MMYMVDINELIGNYLEKKEKESSSEKAKTVEVKKPEEPESIPAAKIKLPSYFKTTKRTNMPEIVPNSAIIKTETKSYSGCSGTSTQYFLNVDGKTKDGQGFHYETKFNYSSELKKEKSKIKSDLEKIVKNIVER
jgi:hypothetical protein